MLARVLYQDPFSPVLTNSSPVQLSLEQAMYINEAIDIACSDSQFATKLKTAITHILSGTATKSPVVSSLNPSSAVLGGASFTLHVRGTNFTPDSKIIFAGQEEPTTFVNATELTTGVNMDLWLGPDVVPVLVQAGNGVMSNAKDFTFNTASTQSTKSTPSHNHPVTPPAFTTPAEENEKKEKK